jgi:hypothetical protein
MTDVGGVGRASGQGPTGRTRTASGAAAGFSMTAAIQPFAGPLAGPIGETTATSLSGLLALQEADAPVLRDRRAQRRGQDLLAALAALQRALLAGGDPADVLGRLASLATDLPSAVDPRLAAVLRAIGLRARVELARDRSVSQ